MQERLAFALLITLAGSASAQRATSLNLQPQKDAQLPLVLLALGYTGPNQGTRRRMRSSWPQDRAGTTACSLLAMDYTSSDLLQHPLLLTSVFLTNQTTPSRNSGVYR